MFHDIIPALTLIDMMAEMNDTYFLRYNPEDFIKKHNSRSNLLHMWMRAVNSPHLMDSTSTKTFLTGLEKGSIVL